MKRFGYFVLAIIGIIIFTALVLCAIIAFAQEASKTKEPIQPFGKIPVSKVPIQQYGPQPAEQPFGKIPGGVAPETKWGPQPAIYPFGQIGPVEVPSSVKQPISGDIPFSDIDAVGTPQSLYTTMILQDFKGGLNLSSYKTKVAPNQAIVLENVLWDEGGDAYKRPGFSEHSTPPFIPNFLYRYYQQDGDKFTMGGSDTSLHFWHEDSSGDGWTYLIGTGGTSGRWDGTTYDDMFVGTHEGIEPVVWDGSSFYVLGQSIDSFYVEDNIYTFMDHDVMLDCREDTGGVEVSSDAGWEPNEWEAYTVKYKIGYFWNGTMYDSTHYRYDLISSNSDHCLFTIPGFEPFYGYIVDESYSWIFSGFGVDSVWREGTVTSVVACTSSTPYLIAGVGFHWRSYTECLDQEGTTRFGFAHSFAKLYDSTFYWDSTFNYNDYIFEAIDGKGKGSKCFLGRYMRPKTSGSWGALNSTWDTLAFFVYGYSAECFDNTTKYRIYASAAAAKGGKVTEVFDNRLWIGWTGVNYIDSVASLEVSDSSYTGEDTTVASIDTTIDSIDPICGDSVQFQGSTQRSSAVPCPHCSTMLAVSYGSITPGEYGDSAISLPVRVYSDASELAYDTLTRYVRIDSNTFTSCYLTFSNSPCAEGKVLYEYPWTYYAKFFFIDTIGTEWREGTVDSATTIGSEGTWLEQCHTRLWDDTYAWDSTVSYNDYYFVVYAGKGVGIKTFLFNHVPCPACAVGWEGDGFLIPNYSSDCFDNTTQYKIYEPNLTADCYIETTFSYDTTWSYGIVWEYYTTIVYDTVYVSNQNKNELIYSAPPGDGGLGNWPPGNQIYLPEDGDYITGMKSLSDARHVDVPAHLLMVTKNASSYKIIPTSTAGLYDSWYISSRVGCVSNSAMSVGEGLVLFPDQNGVWAWDQRSKPQCISLLIDPIFEDLALENLEDMSAIYNPQDRHYYLSGPELFEIDTTMYIGDFIVDFIATHDIWTHRIDSAGVKMGTPDTLAATYAGVYDQRIATDTAGRYVVSYLLGATPYIQKFGADDQEVGDSIRVCDVQRMTHAASVGAEVTMDNDGNIICCWADTSGGNMKTIDIYCQYIDWDDGKIDTNFVVNSNWAVNDHTQNGHHGVEINNDGLFVVVWHDTRDAEAGPVNEEVYGQRYQVHDGDSVEALGSNFNISEINAAGCGAWAQAVSVSNENFVVTWHGLEGNSLMDVWKRLYTIEGVALESRTAVNVQASGRNHGWARVDMNDWGEYVIAYLNDEDLEDSYNLQFRKYSLTTAVGDEVEPMSQQSPTAVYPDVALANNHIFVIAWSDTRIEVGNPYTFYQAYRWRDTLTANVLLADSSVLENNDLEVFIDMPDFMLVDTNCYTLAWNIDYHGWSKETFSASAYAYQHGLTDPVKVIFADPEDTKVYNYATQADDVDDAVILTYQSPYFSLSEQYPFRYRVKAATIESYLDTGTVYLDWYKDYSVLAFQDSLMCGADCWQRKTLSADVRGKNVSVKLMTGSQIDTFILSRIIWELLIE